MTLKEGSNSIIESIKKELKNYFAGNLKNFTTPIQFDGTTFQRCVWQALLEIPFGEVRNYSEQAHRIKKPQAFRAVANANGKNFLSIIVPCHRVINKNGNLGGYGGGIERKAWLLNHEKNY
ncbi:MAG: methylated-DNA--[protein]-cysteine S-methyltransferase [Myxococcales bacterium]|nr:methylated-DNA--[protein]-cysteine S-methyltransferase [Myxococcales bacterium]USN51975.1 MAG: methylated-DNA--[protein]-cysteine S-methyltransferase [Myxococcales bacterium]